jgi:hypothetical protein
MWEPQGLVFAPDRELWWQRSHAALPAVLALGGPLHRVYFTSRDAHQRSHVGWFDLDLDSLEVRDRCTEPVLAPGPRGHFDGDGVWGSSVVRVGDEVWLYTIGWNAGLAPLYYPSIGLAVSTDGGATFARRGRSPLLARSEHDPWMVSGPHVLREPGGWRMWYLSGQGWDGDRSLYDVKLAVSDDGLAWRRDGHVCFAHRDATERNIARACVLPGYRAWYSFDRGAGYRLGYAESADGVRWERHDREAGLDGTVAYPFVVDRGDRLVLLYNGDGFGRDGVHAAVRRVS